MKRLKYVLVDAHGGC